MAEGLPQGLPAVPSPAPPPAPAAVCLVRLPCVLSAAAGFISAATGPMPFSLPCCLIFSTSSTLVGIGGGWSHDPPRCRQQARFRMSFGRCQRSPAFGRRAVFAEVRALHSTPRRKYPLTRRSFCDLRSDASLLRSRPGRCSSPVLCPMIERNHQPQWGSGAHHFWVGSHVRSPRVSHTSPRATHALIPQAELPQDALRSQPVG